MKRPSFLEGSALALAAAVAAGLGLPALSWLSSPGDALALLLAALSLAYLAYLLVRTPQRVGGPISLAVWLLLTGSLWLLDASLPTQVLAHLGLLSLLRALYFHSGPLGALADLGLTGLALTAALGAYLHTGSPFLTVWCLFLVLALWVLIPTRGSRRPQVPDDDPFERAHRSAELALRKSAAPR
jgi:hypothetical protein